MIATGRKLLIFALVVGVSSMVAGPMIAQTMSMGSGDDDMSTMGNDDMSMMGDLDISMIPRIPPVAGYAKGEQIFFLHTEVSDPEIGAVMTDMMGSPVPVVPSLADAPETMLANVWAFTNGVQPDGPRGPLGFQPDIFDHPVGSTGYRPLRMLYLVTWSDGTEPRLLTSASELAAARDASELTQDRTGIVVNMPFLVWPGGQR